MASDPVAGDLITCPWCGARHELLEPQPGTLTVDCPKLIPAVVDEADSL